MSSGGRKSMVGRVRIESTVQIAAIVKRPAYQARKAPMRSAMKSVSVSPTTA